jgi:hypothetical protein
MGIAAEMNGYYPRDITLTLSCDAAACLAFEAFTSPDGYVGCHAAAMTKGWLERQAPQGRLWLCPKCSGKRS